ncbi:DinB family protein [Gracilimonas sp. Q87]|uniref:DinB family protein n=1 Tax=Gracilimonas sp. Q87 TaxID=3384766 RepID=UPI0039840222
MMYEMWLTGRTRLTGQLDSISEDDLSKRLHPESNSVGWMLRHMAEVELLFAKNVFGKELEIKAQTIGSLAKDRGKFTKLKELLDMIEEAENELGSAIKDISDWEGTVTTAEFGTVTKAQALGRVMTHTALHSGQLSLALKYGS